MKKLLFLPLFTTLALTAAGHPYTVSSQTQYMNTLVDSISTKYTRLEENNTSTQVNLDALYSEYYTLANLDASYVYNNRVGISIYLPYVNYHNNELNPTVSESSMGDASVGISFDAGSFDNDLENKNIFELRYTYDSGDVKKGTGMGAQSVAILWETIGKIDDFTLYGSLMWTYYITDTESGIDIGADDLLWFGASHPCLLSDKVETNLKFMWQSKYSDHDQNSDKITDSYYDIIDITLQWDSDRLIKNIPLTAGIRVPVYSSSHIDTSVNAFIGIGGLF